MSAPFCICASADILLWCCLLTFFVNCLWLLSSNYFDAARGRTIAKWRKAILEDSDMIYWNVEKSKNIRSQSTLRFYLTSTYELAISSVWWMETSIFHADRVCCLIVRRHIVWTKSDTFEENGTSYKLSDLVSIFNMTCSQFASVIYHGFRMLYGAIGKFTKGFQLVGRFIHINFVP